MKMIHRAEIVVFALLISPSTFAADFTAGSKFPPVSSEAVGPQTRPNGRFGEQVYNLPVGDRTIRAVVYKPAAFPAPWKIVILNHGSPGPARGSYATNMLATKFFLDRGYMVVLPTRRGFGVSGGQRADDWGNCNVHKHYQSGMAGADDVISSLNYFLAQDFTQKDGALLVGQSNGGFAVTAAAGNNPKGVAGIINFSGGISNGQSHCGAASVLDAYKRYGVTARLPTIFVYAENDTHFSPDYSKRMFEAYASTGANVKYVLLPPIGDGDGHVNMQKDIGVKAWTKPIDGFIASLAPQ